MYSGMSFFAKTEFFLLNLMQMAGATEVNY